MQTSKQLSVTLVNKPGRLADVLSALNQQKVNCLALSVMNAGERGTLRFVPDDFKAATEALEQRSVRYEATDVLLVTIPFQQGAFSKVCERLAAEHLNIDYAYCSFGIADGAKSKALAVFKVNDLAKAQRVLTENGVVRRKLPGRRPVYAR